MTTDDMNLDDDRNDADDHKDQMAATSGSDNNADAGGDSKANADTGGSMKRDSLDGVWILDKSKQDWSMRGYLETLHVNELAIQAHEKGELEHDTYHTITTDKTNNVIKIVKRSRVNNDLVVELTIGQEKVEHLQPGDRPKKSLATTEDNLQSHVQIQSSLLTMNGLAHVTDIKRLHQEQDKTILVQHLTIVNDETKATKTTTRYFIPYNGSMDMD